MAKTRKSKGLLGFLFRPVSDLLKGTKGVLRTTSNTVRNVASRGINAVNSVGKKVTNTANAVVKDVMPRRKSKNSRKSRKNSRKNSRRNRN